jgi:hypothetical protein
MEMSQWNTLYSSLKQTKMPFFFKNGEPDGKIGPVWGIIQLWYIVRTLVNVTMYPQYHNNMIIKKKKKEWPLPYGAYNWIEKAEY